MAELAATPAAAPGGQVDPYRAYNFKLLINGVTNGHFTEVSGMEINIARMAYKDGPNDSIRFVPGQVDYEPVVLHFGLTSSREVWAWLNSPVHGGGSRAKLSVVLCDA